ncbi:prepilin-type N-terminal cleavage/methylation domain-containing protein [Candidatus Microgenomates bacterium]|nr:prepilin-type N-terminal cleavage/methylation domain-containing protein [Candidatus Microgenomates bacterium]
MRKTKGFTLIEVLVAATIISLLTSIGVVSYRTSGRQSRDAKRRADLEQIRVSLEMIRADCNVYPLTADGPPWGTTWTYTCGLLSNIYMQDTPQDPKAPDYTYVYTSDGSTYFLCAYLENGTGNEGAFCVNNCDVAGPGPCNYKVVSP